MSRPRSGANSRSPTASRLHRSGLCLAAALLLVLGAACSGADAPSSYGTVDAIIAALEKEGVRCSGIEELDGAKLVREGASCKVDGKPVVARTFASASRRDDWLKVGASFGSSVLVGPNWVIATDAEDTAESLQEAIGGTLH